MEVFSTDSFYIFWNGISSLWFEKSTATFEIKTHINPPENSDLECLGECYGIIGKVTPFKNNKFGCLVVISEESLIGAIYQHSILKKIDKITLLPFNENEFVEIPDSTNNLNEPKLFNDLQTCSKHFTKNTEDDPHNSNTSLQKTWKTLKSAAETVIPNKIQVYSDLLFSELDEYDDQKLAKRIYNEIIKLFNNTDSFYYSKSIDITNSAQRYHGTKKVLNNANMLSYDWRNCDERFFWNHDILTDLLNIQGCSKEILSEWVIPIILGYIHVGYGDLSEFNSDLNELLPGRGKVKVEKELASSLKTGFLTSANSRLTYCLISRRNKHRTGTRYNRRGLDGEGNAANYVETEQLIFIADHVLSFGMIRGSIPLYWTQGGMKYRPPPTLEKNDEENYEAFKKHFDREIQQYNRVVIVNLAEQSGREKLISEAFLDQVLKYDSPKLIYVTFDFHEYCHGMKFENISVLTESVADIIKHMQYCWFDSKGFIGKQTSIFRINCIDCLDRTNMVQMAFAKIILEIQLRKIGLLAPETDFPTTLKKLFQYTWANNGDALSLQYAGTAALKSDFTRTGQKKLTSLFKDGYNSATRYYMNQFRDAYRQLAYQTLQNTCSLNISEEISSDDNTAVSSSSQPQPQSLSTTYNNIRKIFSSSEIPIMRRLLKPILMATLPHQFEEEGEDSAKALLANLKENRLEEFNDSSHLKLLDLKSDSRLSKICPSQPLAFTSEDALIDFILKEIVPDNELIYGSWLIAFLSKCKVGNDEIQAKPSLLVISSQAYYVFCYDTIKVPKINFQVTHVAIVNLNLIKSLDLGYCLSSKDSYLVGDRKILPGYIKVRYQECISNSKNRSTEQEGTHIFVFICDNATTSTSLEESFNSLQTVFECFKAIRELMDLRFDVVDSYETTISQLQNTLKNCNLIDSNTGANKILNYTEALKIIQDTEKPTKSNSLDLPLSLREDISLNAINNLHLNDKYSIHAPLSRKFSEPEIATKNKKKSEISKLTSTTKIPEVPSIRNKASLPLDWENVLNPGVDQTLQMKCQQTNKSALHPVTKSTTTTTTNELLDDHLVSYNFKDGDDDQQQGAKELEDRKRYALMKAKLKSKTRILEL